MNGFNNYEIHGVREFVGPAGIEHASPEFQGRQPKFLQVKLRSGRVVTAEVRIAELEKPFGAEVWTVIRTLLEVIEIAPESYGLEAEVEGLHVKWMGVID
jgi:hypothetical protein